MKKSKKMLLLVTSVLFIGALAIGTMAFTENAESTKTEVKSTVTNKDGDSCKKGKCENKADCKGNCENKADCKGNCEKKANCSGNCENKADCKGNCEQKKECRGKCSH